MHCDHLRMSSDRVQPYVPQVAVARSGLTELSRTAATDDRASSIGVIVADDHTMFRQGLVALFQAELNIKLLGEAADSRAAWELIESFRPEVAILALSRPDLTYLEVVSMVERANLDTRIVFLAMNDDPATACRALDTGVAGYVLKENLFEELMLAVQSVAAGNTFVTRSIRAKLRAFQSDNRQSAPLSQREREVIRMIGLGKSSKEIARILQISPRTVDTYRQRLMDKLGLHSLADVVRHAVQAGLLEGGPLASLARNNLERINRRIGNSSAAE